MINIIVETGEGLPESNSYITPQFASDYAEFAGTDVWCNNTNKHELAIVQASSFLDSRYFRRYCGTKLNPAQGLLLPRNISGHSSSIPESIRKATAYLAIQFLIEGNLDLNANSDAAIKSQGISLGNGAISETVTYYDNESAKNTFSAFAQVDAYIDQAMNDIGCGSTNNSIFVPIWKS